MTFEELLDQAIALLQRRGRVTYRTLKIQFDLDDDHLEALKEELLYSQSQVRDEDGRGLVWTGDASPTATSPPAATPAGATTNRAPLTYTPPHLAEKILTSRSALEGERKQVTVLFCDITNSTPLAERLGPEAMHTLLNQFFELALAAIHRYEGTINQFLGDGFMALFGAPIAHEDHARRAVLAALDIQRALHERRGDDTSSIQVRLGLNTGLVVVGAIGDNLRMDYTAVGDTTNLAARLQQVAAPGQIVISEATHRLVAGYCDTQSLGVFSLKGKSDPVQAWEVLTARADRTRLEVEAERGLTPFVGRERELRLLHECFAQAQAGQGQVVFLVGEPGIGKSRLLLEFRRQLGTDCHLERRACHLLWTVHGVSSSHRFAQAPLWDRRGRPGAGDCGEGYPGCPSISERTCAHSCPICTTSLPLIQARWCKPWTRSSAGARSLLPCGT